MKKNDIIRELFSYLKNETFEERLIDISNLLNQFYKVENDFEKLRQLPHTTIKRYLEIIIHVVNGNSKKVIDEKEIESFLNNISNIDYVTFKKKLSKYNLFRFFQKELGLDQKTVENISALVLLLSISGGTFFIYNEIDKTFIDVDYSSQKASMVALANNPSIDDDINSVLKMAQDELKKEEEKKIENDVSEVAFEESTVEPSTNQVVLSEENNHIVDEHMDDLALSEEPIPSEEPLEPLNLKKPVTESNLGEYEIPYTPTDPNKKDSELATPSVAVESTSKNVLDSVVNPNPNASELITVDERIQYILDRYNLTLEQFNIVKSIVMAEAMYDSYDDGYAVINTMYNRTLSKSNNNFVNYFYGEGAGRSLYYQAIAPNQFVVYQNGMYEKNLTKNDGPVYDAIIDFLTTEKIKHSYLNFLSANTNMTRAYEEFAHGGNKYFEELVESDLIVVEDNTNSRS